MPGWQGSVMAGKTVHTECKPRNFVMFTIHPKAIIDFGCNCRLKIEENERCSSTFFSINFCRSIYSWQWYKYIAENYTRMGVFGDRQRTKREKAIFRTFWIGVKTPEDSFIKFHSEQWGNVDKKFQAFLEHRKSRTAWRYEWKRFCASKKSCRGIRWKSWRNRCQGRALIKNDRNFVLVISCCNRVVFIFIYSFIYLFKKVNYVWKSLR